MSFVKIGQTIQKMEGGTLRKHDDLINLHPFLKEEAGGKQVKMYSNME
jgi:hypothetical protein